MVRAATSKTRPAIHAELDHLVWAVPDLERAIHDLERRLGTRAAPGGHHPGVGTRNALIDLGARRYLEILAPDPAQDRLTGFGRHVADLTAPRLVAWAVRTSDLDAWVEAARADGLEPGPILDMQRRRPDGSLLAWRLASLVDDGGRLPFCLEWQDRHPCDVLPASGCRLVHLRLGAGPRLVYRLDALGCEIGDEIVISGGRGLAAVLETPRGRVELA